MLKAALFFAGLLAFTATSLANENNVWNEQYIQRAVLTTSVESREPVDDLGADYQHSGLGIDQLTFFTHIINHSGRDVVHQWYHEGSLQAEVPLRVGSDSWRTYSTKRIHGSATGSWHVAVTDTEGSVLLEHHFTISP